METKDKEVTCPRSPVEGRKGEGVIRGKAPNGGRVGAAREWKENQESLAEGGGPCLLRACPDPC